MNKEYNEGYLIVSRRPKDSAKSETDYRVCPSCKCVYSKYSIRKHYRKCIPNKKKGDRSILIRGKWVHGQVHENACPVLKNAILPVMREDEVMALIRYDELIISYGNALCTKYRLEHMRPMIRTRLRLIGRFLLEIKKIYEGVTDFASVFTPDRFDAAIEAINALAGLDKTKQEYKSPFTAFEIGSQLKKCGKHFITMCIKSKDKNRKTEVQDFLKILEEELAVCINKTVMENQLQHKRLKKINLPTSQNIAGFNNYLNKKRQLFHKKLEAAFDYNYWKELASLTLISIQTFNRRRAGEVERMMVADFKNYQSMSSNNDPELLDNLSEVFKLKGKICPCRNTRKEIQKSCSLNIIRSFQKLSIDS
ncbi:hypothetical protein JTB14_018064 [Gonioctena quinquepunctata]|nr:hypothetical protein JTB14_018064 [Gonioctena quinquepunctata]